ncbi:hypothetical protein RFI_08722 [Reticulomyxa filosa]|uniref:Peptidase S9 prolyl oligopeptidase catalytic domain-containing protein n=1 Tax=Reticulomyxa filosa TaxID=46433 RepID=X6NRT5_RETFI|nr:hypothetical protein RFI_08722 [Reticulomyxa filosa]|eukprot:ETO28409.1 hypothetical protein RFI_08722 [Reticulomyxa filosa]
MHGVDNLKKYSPTWLLNHWKQANDVAYPASSSSSSLESNDQQSIELAKLSMSSLFDKALLNKNDNSSSIDRVTLYKSLADFAEQCSKRWPKCLLIHSTKDTVVPFSSSNSFFQALTQLHIPVELLPYNGCSHYDHLMALVDPYNAFFSKQVTDITARVFDNFKPLRVSLRDQPLPPSPSFPISQGNGLDKTTTDEQKSNEATETIQSDTLPPLNLSGSQQTKETEVLQELLKGINNSMEELEVAETNRHNKVDDLDKLRNLIKEGH